DMGGIRALIARFEGDIDGRGIGLRPSAATATREAYYAVDRRIVAHKVDDLSQPLAHQLKRDALVRRHRAQQPARILLWEEALRHCREQDEIERDRRRQQYHHG